MWEAWQKGLTDGSQRRYEMAWRLYQEHRSHFADSWRLWSPQIRQAFTFVALTQIRDLLPDQKVLAKPFAQSLPNYKQELREMEGLGLLVDDDRYEGGYRIAQELMLWWLVDQLMRVLRNEIFFEEWLQRYELRNSRTHQALRQLPKLLNQPELLEHGVSTLIKRFAGVKLKAQPDKEVPEPNQSKPPWLIDRLKNFFDTLGL